MLNVDNHKLMYHPKRVSEWLEKGDCFPVYAEVGLTDRCNHKCIFCAYDWAEKTGVHIDSEKLKYNIKDMAENGLGSMMFAGEGEPLLHKDVASIIQYTKQNGIDVAIATNGALLNKKMSNEILPYLSWIRFSIDAGTKKTHSKIHGIKKDEFERIIDNISYASSIKKEKKLDVVLGTQFLLLSENFEEIALAAKKLKDAGADNIQIKPYSHHPLSKNDYSVDYSKYSYLENELKGLEDKTFKVFFRKATMERLGDKNEYKECHGLPFFALIESNGEVAPCHLFHGNNEFSYGNIYHQKFSELWKGDKRKQVLQKLSDKGVTDCRNGCRLDPINRYLNRLKNPHEHDKFI